MAIDFDPVLTRWKKSPRNVWGLSRRLSAPLVTAIRKVQNRSSALHSSHRASSRSTSVTLSNGEKLISAHNLEEQGWAYIPEFFSSDTHQFLLDEWPRLSLFSPPRLDLAKSYDTLPFGWSHRRRPVSPDVSPFVYSVFDLLFSEETARLVTNLVGDGVPRVGANVGLSWARHHHYLLPHRDSNSEGDGSWVNFIIFVDGKDEPLSSGGTSIFRTNRYDEVIFSPLSLRNTAICYDTRGSFYHGFPPVRWGGFSKRIICNFASENELALE